MDLRGTVSTVTVEVEEGTLDMEKWDWVKGRLAKLMVISWLQFLQGFMKTYFKIITFTN